MGLIDFLIRPKWTGAIENFSDIDRQTWNISKKGSKMRVPLFRPKSSLMSKGIDVFCCYFFPLFANSSTYRKCMQRKVAKNDVVYHIVGYDWS